MYLLTCVFNAFTSPSLLPQTIETILLEFPATAQGERGVFWDEATQRHKNPLKEVEGGFWFANWDVKVRLPFFPNFEVWLLTLYSSSGSFVSLLTGN
jgi:hypothetical protein